MCRKYESLIHGFNDDAPADTDGLAAASAYYPSDDELNFDPDSYVPDDFEPDLDPYDRHYTTKRWSMTGSLPAAGILLISTTAWMRSRIRLGSAAMVIQWIDYSNKFHI